MSSLPFIAALLLAVALAPASAASHSKRKIVERSSQRGVPYATHDEAMRWADEVAQRRGLDPAWVREAVARAQFLPVVSRLMQPAPPGTPKNWRVYRSRFIDPVRIAAGVRFWRENEAVLQRAYRDYGVPPEIIVGIIGVETIYGRQMGTFRVLDALATLSFNFPESHPRAAERTAFFRGELEQFLVLQALRGADPLQPVGSFAGAMGMPQFMPTSIARWAIDFDGDGRIDLTRSPADVIGSVANYFKSFGWNPGMPTHYEVRFDLERLDKEALLTPDILPTFSVPSFLAKGAVLDGAAVRHEGPLGLVELQNGEAEPSYVAGTENFYVITRYNWSSYYAMAVIELGQEVRRALEPERAAQPVAPETPASTASPAAPALPAEPPAPAPAAVPVVPTPGAPPGAS